MKKPVKWQRWLTGDVEIAASAPRAHKREWRKLRADLARAARSCGERWNINSGYRSYAEQLRLYDLYLSGKGNLAAKPGASNHTFGKAADTSGPDWMPIGTLPRHRRALRRFGLCLPVPGEKWHVERDHGQGWRA